MRESRACAWRSAGRPPCPSTTEKHVRTEWPGNARPNPPHRPTPAPRAQTAKHADAVVLGVHERHVVPDAGNLHRFAQHLAAGLGDLLHGRVDVVHRDDDGRVLRGPVGLACVEAAIDGAGVHRATWAGLGRRNRHVVTHLFAEHLSLPTEGGFIEARHTGAVVVRHFKVNHGIHDRVSFRLHEAVKGWRPVPRAGRWQCPNPPENPSSRGRHSPRPSSGGRGRV